jgi:hypothetical protein
VAKKKNLEGYKRQGKRYIPPMKQLPMVRELSYVNDMLPELIWLGLIHDRNGYHFGVRTLEAIVSISKDWPTSGRPNNYALHSAYAALTDGQKEALVAGLTGVGLIDDIRFALAPLAQLYDNFALAFLGPPSESIPRETLIRRIADTVSRHLNKYETPGIALNGAMLVTRLSAGTIKFSSQIEIPDFNSVFERPDSEEARRAASFMRAGAIGEFGMLDLPRAWAEHFWNRGGELTPCQRPEYARDGW